MNKWKTPKGTGKHINNTLNAHQVWQLTKLIDSLGEDQAHNHTAASLSALATEKLGFVVTESNAQTFRKTVFPSRTSEGKGVFAKRISILESRIEKLEAIVNQGRLI